MLLGSLTRSCMTARTRNSYHVSYSPRDNTLSGERPKTATDLPPTPPPRDTAAISHGTGHQQFPWDKSSHRG